MHKVIYKNYQRGHNDKIATSQFVYQYVIYIYLRHKCIILTFFARAINNEIIMKNVQ